MEGNLDNGTLISIASKVSDCDESQRYSIGKIYVTRQHDRNFRGPLPRATKLSEPTLIHSGAKKRYADERSEL